MTRIVHLHIGSPKSGTTYLQSLLEHNRERLADAGVLVVGEQHVDRVHAALQVREDRRWRQLPPARQDMWGTLVRQIKDWPGDVAVLSYELFCAATAQQAARMVADLAEFEVHVVLTARDLGRSLPSAWQERLKFGLVTPLQDWEPPSSEDVRSEWGWRTTDPTSVLERWAGVVATERLHLVTVPVSSSDPAELWQRFTDACSLGHVPVDTAVPRSNESLGVVQAEVLRRVNERLVPPLDANREQARWLRDTLAHRVLAKQPGDALAMTDVQFSEARTRSEAAVAALSISGHPIHGDVLDLLATRPQGRTPDQVSDAEVLESALTAIVDLLLVQREDTRARSGREAGELSTMVRIARKVTGPVVSRRGRATRERIADLEREVQASRELHQRVAMLQDVVSELLIPVDLRDDEQLRSALREYRRNSL